MSGKSVDELRAEMEIGACVEYGNYLLNLLSERQKSSNPGIIFVSRTMASVHDLSMRERDIKKQISAYISGENSKELVQLLLEIERVACLVSENATQKRPPYMKLMLLIHEA